jgi:hypothetical protein
MPNFQSGVTAKPPVLRLHRIKTSGLSLNITEIWQLRRRKKPKLKLLDYFVLFVSLTSSEVKKKS